jgi:hypothetical protein
VQIRQGIQRHSRRPKGHAGANARIEHPVWQYRYNTRLDLNMDDAAARAPLTVMRSYASAVVRMPAVVNLNVMADMGRMTA